MEEASSPELVSQEEVDKIAAGIVDGRIPAHIRVFSVDSEECVYDSASSDKTLAEWATDHLTRDYRMEICGVSSGASTSQSPPFGGPSIQQDCVAPAEVSDAH